MLPGMQVQHIQPQLREEFSLGLLETGCQDIGRDKQVLLIQKVGLQVAQVQTTLTGESCVIQVVPQVDLDQMVLLEPRLQATQQDCLQTSQ
jgi:hypothetical protein